MPNWQPYAFLFWYRVKAKKGKTLTKTIRTPLETETRAMYKNRKSQKKGKGTKKIGRKTNKISAATDRGISLQLAFHRKEDLHQYLAVEQEWKMGQRPTRIRRERLRDGQEQPMTELRGQLRAMEEQITYLQRQLSTRDWVISRNEMEHGVELFEGNFAVASSQ